jgi:hypothetical protein
MGQIDERALENEQDGTQSHVEERPQGRELDRGGEDADMMGMHIIQRAEHVDAQVFDPKI